MINSLRDHSVRENYKQLRLRMKKQGLDTIQVEVTCHAGKFKYNFTGAPEQVVQANAILAAWA